MTKRQKKRILAIIAKDCMTSGRNIDDLGHTCVVGALSIAAGVSQRWLKQRQDGDQSITSSKLDRLPKMIEKAFGLDLDQLSAMQEANDSINKETPRHVQRRRAAVAKVVRGFEVE